MRKVAIIGGGLAGLISGIQLARAGVPCAIIEKKSYPLHRVCGEYVSNEATPFLKRKGLYPEIFSPPQINCFQLSSVKGREAKMPLDLGGFGVSRFAFDHFLYKKALEAGAEVVSNTEVQKCDFISDKFIIHTPTKTIEADLVIGAFGKRSKLDIALNRSFMSHRSPYAAIKYHIHTDHPDNLIALHNFRGGYCGMSNIEDGKTNLCYLTHRDSLRKYGDIKALEEQILFENPLLKYVFLNSDFLFDKPEVINEISFETKTPVVEHILMAGDAAGMITPLCGNGMAMAIHTAGMVADLALEFCRRTISRPQMEQLYSRQWQKSFSARLWRGRTLQKLFGDERLSDLAVNVALYVKPVARVLVRNTHGEVF